MCMKSIWCAGFGAIVVIGLVAGCESGTKKAALLPGAESTASPAITETAVLPAAALTYSNLISVSADLGEEIPFPFIEPLVVTQDKTNVLLTVDYTHYMEPVQGTGWRSLDEFTLHPTSYSAVVEFASLPMSTDTHTMVMLGGRYALNLGNSVARAGLNLGQISDGGTDDLLGTVLSYDYYLLKNLSVGASWNYEHVKADDGDTDSDNWFRLNVGYLFDMSNPLLVKFNYARWEINNSDFAMNGLGISADWVIAEKWLAGVTLTRLSDEDSWSDFVLMAGVNGGYQITPNITAGLGYNMAHFGGSDNDYGGFSVNYAQRF
jgi:opacity protein-like surface antigen